MTPEAKQAISELLDSVEQNSHMDSCQINIPEPYGVGEDGPCSCGATETFEHLNEIRENLEIL